MASPRTAVEVEAPALSTNTTKALADNVWEYLVSCHDKLDTITSHIYGDDGYSIPTASPCLHGTLETNSELATALATRLDNLWNRL